MIGFKQLGVAFGLAILLFLGTRVSYGSDLCPEFSGSILESKNKRWIHAPALPKPRMKVSESEFQRRLDRHKAEAERKLHLKQYSRLTKEQEFRKDLAGTSYSWDDFYPYFERGLVNSVDQFLVYAQNGWTLYRTDPYLRIPEVVGHSVEDYLRLGISVEEIEYLLDLGWSWKINDMVDQRSHIGYWHCYGGLFEGGDLDKLVKAQVPYRYVINVKRKVPNILEADYVMYQFRLGAAVHQIPSTEVHRHEMCKVYPWNSVEVQPFYEIPDSVLGNTPISLPVDFIDEWNWSPQIFPMSPEDDEYFSTSFEEYVEENGITIERISLAEALRISGRWAASRIEGKERYRLKSKNKKDRYRLRAYCEEGKGDCTQFEQLFEVAFDRIKRMTFPRFQNVYLTALFSSEIPIHSVSTLIIFEAGKITLSLLDPTALHSLQELWDSMPQKDFDRVLSCMEEKREFDLKSLRAQYELTFCS